MILPSLLHRHRNEIHSFWTQNGSKFQTGSWYPSFFGAINQDHKVDLGGLQGHCSYLKKGAVSPSWFWQRICWYSFTRTIIGQFLEHFFWSWQQELLEDYLHFQRPKICSFLPRAQEANYFYPFILWNLATESLAP